MASTPSTASATGNFMSTIGVSSAKRKEIYKYEGNLFIFSCPN